MLFNYTPVLPSHYRFILETDELYINFIYPMFLCFSSEKCMSLHIRHSFFSNIFI